jgi:hypothetical protein
MLTDPITDEHPSIHWQHMTLPPGTVLDLGCGWDQKSERGHGVTTAAWFAGRGATVFGVDCDVVDLVTVARQTPGTYVGLAINDAETMRALVYLVEPSCIKCDIEGAEAYLFQVVLPPCVRELAIECHNATLERACLEWMQAHGFEVIANQPLSAHPTIKVVTARRP